MMTEKATARHLMDSLDELGKRVLSVLRAIPKDDNKKSFETWVGRWQKCIKYKENILNSFNGLRTRLYV